MTNETKTLAEVVEAHDRKLALSPWYPASGGTETPFLTKSGHRVQYMYQPGTHTHAYYDCGSDLFLSAVEAEALGL